MTINCVRDYHRTTEWEDLEWLVGVPLVCTHGLANETDLVPDEVVIEKVYPNCVLIRQKWVKSTWPSVWLRGATGICYTRWLVPKVDLMTGHVSLMTKDTRYPVTGDAVSGYRYVKPIQG